MNSDGSNQRRLTNSPQHDNKASWSPDGSRIAFISDRSGASELYTMRSDGSDVQQLTSDGVGKFWEAWRP